MGENVEEKVEMEKRGKWEGIKKAGKNNLHGVRRKNGRECSRWDKIRWKGGKEQVKEKRFGG